MYRSRHTVRTALAWREFFQAAAQVVKQLLEVVLLCRLCGIVRGPVLLVRLLRGCTDRDGFCDGDRSVRVVARLPLGVKLDRVNVLALEAFFAIRASAGRFGRIDVDGVSTVAAH